MCVCVCVCIRPCVCVCVHAGEKAYMYSSIHPCTRMCAYARMQTCMYLKQTHTMRSCARTHEEAQEHRHTGVRVYRPLHVLYCSVPENPRVLQEAGAQQPAEAAASYPHTNRVKHGL